jgi:hypothetical protein
MESLAVLSLTCNILDLITACKEAAQVYSSIREKGYLDLDLSKNAARIHTISTNVEAVIQRQSATASIRPAQAELLSTAQECLKTANEIEVVVNDINNRKGSFRKFVKTWKKKGSLNVLNGSLQMHQNTLNSLLLKDIW